VWNANYIKSKKSELANFLYISILDIVAISETKLTPKHKFSVPGYCVYHADWNHFCGGVMLLITNNVCHDQFMLPNVVNLEIIAVCLYLQNNILLLFVSCCNPPDSPVPHFDLDSLFSSFDSVALVDDLNCKHTAWNLISVDRNSQTLLSYYLKTLHLTALITPYTYIPTSDLVSLILLSQSTIYCPIH
jgi:hypothetical protein